LCTAIPSLRCETPPAYSRQFIQIQREFLTKYGKWQVSKGENLFGKQWNRSTHRVTIYLFSNSLSLTCMGTVCLRKKNVNFFYDKKMAKNGQKTIKSVFSIFRHVKLYFKLSKMFFVLKILSTLASSNSSKVTKSGVKLTAIVYDRF
jgi:hypothetical protein